MEININKELELTTEKFKKNIPEDLLKPTDLNLLILDTLFDYIVIFLSILLYLNSTLILKIISIIIIVSRLHSFGVILHELTHLPMKKKNYKIIILEYLVGYPVGSTLNAMRYHHLRHHKDNGMHNDPYFHHFENYEKNHILIKMINIFIGFILIPSWILRSLIGGWCLLNKNLQIIYAKLFFEHKGELKPSDLDEIRECCKEDIKQASYLIIMFLIIFKIAGLNLIFQLYFIPILITGIVSYYRLMKEHDYTRVYDRKLSTVINITNDHNINNPLSFLLAPRNIGYHVAHHLHPQVGYRNLKKIRDYYLKNNKKIYK